MISIHALVKRATTSIISNLYNVFDFNPRPREEGDTVIPVDHLPTVISIHALVKRATVYSNFNNHRL